jgi:hypothetical protein
MKLARRPSVEQAEEAAVLAAEVVVDMAAAAEVTVVVADAVAAVVVDVVGTVAEIAATVETAGSSRSPDGCSLLIEYFKYCGLA